MASEEKRTEDALNAIHAQDPHSFAAKEADFEAAMLRLLSNEDEQMVNVPRQWVCELCRRHNMRTNPIAQKIEQMVGEYFEACKMQDAKAISTCFAPGAVHYLPHFPPLHGGATIGNALVNDLRNRGGRYFIDKILTNVEQCAAGVEWSRTFQQEDRILRGYEFCEFDPASMLIREIRGYYAAVPDQNIARHELVGFDYAGRGYRNVS